MTYAMSSNRVVHRVLEEVWAVAAAVNVFTVSRRTMRKWLARSRSDGPAG